MGGKLCCSKSKNQTDKENELDVNFDGKNNTIIVNKNKDGDEGKVDKKE